MDTRGELSSCLEDGDDDFARCLESHLDDPDPKFIGIEEVFEANTEDFGGFKRERSKLTRDERIALAKARRERKELGLIPANDDWVTDPSETQNKRTSGGIGPGVEVVQELKDVIWRVGERRRKERWCEMSRTHSRCCRAIISQSSKTLRYFLLTNRDCILAMWLTHGQTQSQPGPHFCGVVWRGSGEDGVCSLYRARG